MIDLGVAGLASGFDWRSFIDQLTEVERIPQKRLRGEQQTLQNRNAAYDALETQLKVLQTRVDTLNDTSLYESRKAESSDDTVGTATAKSGSAVGSYKLDITQMATASKQRGSSDIGQSLSATNDVSGLVLSDAGFTTSVTAGTITVNGQQINVATSDTLQDVFDSISTATGGAVTGSYDAATDKITLSSAGEIVLGSANDSSNLLKVSKLYNNGSGTVSSNGSLGGVRQTVAMDTANFSTAISDGGSGAGEFKINGVSINFSSAGDSLANVIERINNSEAGVTASYDAVNDRMVLTNKTTGDLGVSMEDVTGNFLSATGLTGGSLERGKNLNYTINDGPTLYSQSNTISEESSGLTGVTINALKLGTSNVNIATDNDKIKDAIKDFIKEYNAVQSKVTNYTASSTDASGKVTAGVLTGQSDANDLAAALRSKVYSTVSGLSEAINHLDDLGIVTNGDNNEITLQDESKLDQALVNNLSGVRQLFTDSTNGLATSLKSYLDSQVGEDGTLISRQDTLTKQIGGIDDQIANMESLVQSNRQALISSFVSMEQAQAKINQQMQFLAQFQTT